MKAFNGLKLLVLLIPIGLACPAWQARAQLLAYEGFNYPTGLLATANGGTGWSSAWAAGNGAGNAVAEPGGAYTSGALNLDAQGNRLRYAGGNTENFRSLPAALGANGTTVYLSFLARVEAASYADVALFNNTTHNFALGRIVNTTVWGVSRTAQGTGLTSISTTNQAFLVCRLQFASGNVTVRFYVNPPLDAEPATSDIGDVVWPGFNFNRIRLRGGTTGVNAWMDELRVGSTYADVTPYNAGPGVASIRVNDVALREGNAGVTNAVFAVRLSEPAAQPVSVNFSTMDGTAVAGSDYLATNGIVTFAPGETNQSIAVAVLGDTEVEPDETFTLVLSNAVNAVITDGQGLGTIQDDDFVLPALIAAESFDYAEGSLGGANGGTGWSGAWTQAGSGNSIVAPGREHQDTDYQLLTAGNTAALAGSNNSNSRRLPYRLGEDGERIYVSFIGQVTAGNYAGLLLTDGASDRYLMGRMFNQAVWGCGQLSGANGVVTTAPTTNESLLVFRYDFTSSNVAVRVYVNPPLAAEPATPGATVVAAPFLFDGVRFAAGNSTASGFLDELRLGTTYAGVTPKTLRPPAVRISDATVSEGDTGTSLLFVLTLSRPSAQPVSVDYATADGTATTADYSSAAGTATFAPGTTNQIITVAVTGDAAPEPDETLFVNLSNPTNAYLADAQGRGTIVDDDTPPQIFLEAGRVMEGNAGPTNAIFTVRLSRAFKLPVSADFATTNTTATAGSDYAATNGTVRFAPGETSRAIPVRVNGDTEVEPNERYLLGLGNAINGVIVDGLAEGLIGDDDTPSRFGEIVKVVETGDAVPGEPGRRFTKFIGPPVINDFNELAFVAITDNAARMDPETGVWFAADGTLHKLTTDRTEPPNGPAGARYSGTFTALNLGDDGLVSFVARVDLPAGVFGPVGSLAAAGAGGAPVENIVVLTMIQKLVSLLAPAVQKVREVARQRQPLPCLEHLGPVTNIGGQSEGDGHGALQSKEGLTFTVTTEGAQDGWSTYHTQPYSVPGCRLAAPGDPVPGDPESTVRSVTPLSASGDAVLITIDMSVNEADIQRILSYRPAHRDSRPILQTDDPLPGGEVVESVERATYGKPGDVVALVQHRLFTPDAPGNGVYLFPEGSPPQLLAAGPPDGYPAFHPWITANRRNQTLAMRVDPPGLRIQLLTPGSPATSQDLLRFGDSVSYWPDESPQTVVAVSPWTMSWNNWGMGTAVTDLGNQRRALAAFDAWGDRRLVLIKDRLIVLKGGGERTPTDLHITSQANSGSGGPRGLNNSSWQAVQITTEPVISPGNPAAGGVFTVNVNFHQPAVTIRREDNRIEIRYSSGTLQHAPEITGPWTDVAGASSPYTTAASAAMRYFQSRQ